MLPYPVELLGTFWRVAAVVAVVTGADEGSVLMAYPVFQADSSNGKAPNYANIFGNLAIDSAGNYCTLFAGTADDRDPAANPYHVYLQVSHDHGHTWSAPIQVDHDSNKAGTHVFPHLAVTAPGNVDVVWYGTTATGAERRLRHDRQPVAVLGRLPALHRQEGAGLECVPGAVDERALGIADLYPGRGESHRHALRQDLYERHRLRVLGSLAARLHQRGCRLPWVRAHHVRRQHQAAGGCGRDVRPRRQPDRWLCAGAARALRPSGSLANASRGPTQQVRRPARDQP
jgi:hypothetical protein